MSTLGVIADRYRIDRELGRGGFGVTYLARDLLTGQQLAVKLAGPGTEFTERFRWEADLLGKINSPHVARVLGFGVFESRPYLAIEYIAGPTLREVLVKVGRLPIPDAVATLRAVATGLAAAHDQNFIHRDLKPANVILRGNSYADAVVIDFGVGGTLGSHGLTREGELFGTIFHMAPEQLKGLPQSTATDVYGAGILLYWMLFGRQPFEGDSITAIFLKILNQEPEIPSASEIPDALRLLLMRCLAKDPARRPQSARELLAELERVQDADYRVESRTQNFDVTAVAKPSAAVVSKPVATSPVSAREPNAPTAVGRVAFRWMKIGVGVALVTSLLLFVQISRQRSGAPRRQEAPVATTPPRPETPIAPAPRPAEPAVVQIPRPSSPPTIAIHAEAIAGIMIALAGIPLGLAIRKWLRKRRSRIEEEATRLLFGAKSRDLLTETLAIEVDRLIRQLDRLDERILGISIAIMVQEFKSAKQTDARQKALMQMVELLEKVRYRLTPWYVRHEKLIAIVASVLTCLSGAATAAANILKPSSHP